MWSLHWASTSGKTFLLGRQLSLIAPTSSLVTHVRQLSLITMLGTMDSLALPQTKILRWRWGHYEYCLIIMIIVIRSSCVIIIKPIPSVASSRLVSVPFQAYPLVGPRVYFSLAGAPAKVWLATSRIGVYSRGSLFPDSQCFIVTGFLQWCVFTQRRLDMRHHSCDIPKVISHVPIDTEQL